MTILSPRYRVVNFRLSSEEYESVYGACVSEGYRTISEFARSAVLNHVRTRSSGGRSLAEDLADISWKLSEVLNRVKGLAGEPQGLAESGRARETSGTEE